jgi:hypothetical protein
MPWFVIEEDIVYLEVIFRSIPVAVLTQFERLLEINYFFNGGFINFSNVFFGSFIKDYSVVRIINLLHCFDPFHNVQSLPTLFFLHPK